MRPTGWGAALWGLAWTLCAVGVLIGSLLPVFCGIAFILYLESTRPRLQSTRLHLDRTHPVSVESNVPFEVTTRVTSDPPAPVRIHDLGLQGTEILRTDRDERRGKATVTARAVIEGVGTRQWTQAQVDVMDPWGIHEHTQTVRARHAVQVAPEHGHRYTGRRIGSKHAVQKLARDRRGHDPSTDLEGIREYHPGDRVRDIDWGHSTRMGELLVRQKEPMAPRPVMVFVDATKTMRWKRRAMRFDSAARMASAVVAGARAAGTRPDLIVCSETEVFRGASSLTDQATSQRLRSATAPLPITRIPYPTRSSADARDRAAASRSGQGLALESGLRLLARSTRGPAFVAAVLDAEWSPESCLTAVRRIQDLGHRLIVIVPAMGPHQFTKQDADRTVLDTLAQGQRNRAQVASTLKGWNVPMLVLTPENVPAIVEEVLRCAK